jgi:hypothetical protein
VLLRPTRFSGRPELVTGTAEWKMPPTEGLVDVAGTSSTTFASGTRDHGRELHQRGDVAARDLVDKIHDCLKRISRQRAEVVPRKGRDVEPAHEASREGRG